MIMKNKNTRLLILNGPNLNLIGKRETAIYGSVSLNDYLNQLKTNYSSILIDYQQFNLEGELIQAIHQANNTYDGIILNPGAYAHTSIALRDAIKAIDIPTVEVHISNVFQRESFRKHSYISDVCKGCIIGFGLQGYRLAVESFIYDKNCFF
ncbi:MAG: type II 3-dehydroquinate dehydratase [Bacteroidales bacterium]